jgi:OPA family glycerol-3-phosphate transporter-like MFS transporter
MYKNSDKTDKLVIFLCWAAYTAAYIGRLNFNAYIEPIREQLGATKTELGIVSSFFFFSYGFGQLVHGVMSRKYNTRYSVAVALSGSAAVNVAMTLCTDVSVMKYIWFLNGVFQSILWSSVIKTLSERLPDEMLSKAVVVMSTPPALGTFLVYGISALFSASKVNYRWIFVLPSVILVIIGSAWFVSIGKVSVNTRNYETANYIPEKKRLKFTPFFAISSVLLVAAAISNGFIKDGVI